MCRVVRHTIQALPLRSMLSSQILGDKTQMRDVFVLNRLLRPLFLLTSSFIFCAISLAQSPAIEPCPATPSPKSTARVTLGPAKTGEKASQTLIDASVADDADLEKTLSPYTEKVRALTLVIGTLDGKLEKGSVGGGNLGNFVTDAIRWQAQKGGNNVSLAIMNAGGLRKNDIAAGTLRASDIFELLPFENALMVLDLTGAQILKIMQSGVRDAQSGAHIQFRWNAQNRAEFISAQLVDSQGQELDIDTDATYSVVTIDYLYNLKSGTYAVLQEAKQVKPLNITLRDAVMEYVKSETAAGRPIKAKLDNRFVQIGPGPTRQEDPPR